MPGTVTGDSRQAAGGVFWDPQTGDPIGWSLAPAADEAAARAWRLPWAELALEQIVTGVRFVAVKLAVVLESPDDSGAGDLCRAVKTAVRRLFHPLHQGPTGFEDWEITRREIEEELAEQGFQVASVEVPTDPIRLVAGQLADLEVEVKGGTP